MSSRPQIDGGRPREHRDYGAHERDAAVPVGNGELPLGTRQRIYLWEQRTEAQARRVMVTVVD